jgi:hypothetical protein
MLVEFPDRLASFTRRIRQQGALVSNLYWPLTDLFGASEDCPAAHDFGSRIINLCVDDTVSPTWVTARARDILEAAPSFTSESCEA